MSSNEIKEKEEEEDNWIHRSKGMRCKTCMSYVKKTGVMETAIDKVMELIEIGRCRRHAPSMTGFPVVYPGDWCGDHKLDESKLGPEEKSNYAKWCEDREAKARKAQATREEAYAAKLKAKIAATDGRYRSGTSFGPSPTNGGTA